jgi:hypothetical protein
MPLPTTFLVTGVVCYVSTVAYGTLALYGVAWGSMTVFVVLTTIFLAIMVLFYGSACKHSYSKAVMMPSN